MMHHPLLDLLSQPTLFVIVLLLVRAVILFPLERAYPANHVAYRSVWLRDTAAWVVLTFAIVPVANGLDRLLALRPTYPGAVLALPFAVRFLLFLLLTDFLYYWAHRLMHSRHVWRIHKWHHSPTYMYWLAGNRGSLLQVGLVFFLSAFADGLLFDAAAGRLALFVLVFNALRNDWMHLNVPWGGHRLEWFVVTPRYHRIHHSDHPDHYEKNLAITFPIFDRLFGTYFDPARAPTISRFGINEPVRPARMALGI